MILSCILAMSENRVIGRDNDLPWHLSADLQRFKRLTTGHTIIMGRRTWQSIGRPLPRRRSIVISRNREYDAPGAEVAHSLEEALELCGDEDEVFVIGGQAVYEEALPRADRLHLTLVHAEVEGDVFFPASDLDGWTLRSAERHDADEKNDFPHTYRVYERTEP